MTEIIKKIDREKIPKGWRTEVLGKIFDVKIGRTPPRIEKQWFSEDSNGIKWISIKDLRNSGTYICSTKENLTEDAVDKFHIPVIKKNTALLSFKLTVGRVSITAEDMLSNEAIAQMGKNDESELSTNYIYSHLKRINYDKLGSTSSIATAINTKVIKELKVTVPERKISNLFENTTSEIFDKIKENTFQIKKLQRNKRFALT